MSVEKRKFNLQLLKKPKIILTDRFDLESRIIKNKREDDIVYCIDCRSQMEYVGHEEWECTKCHTVCKIESASKEEKKDNRWVSMKDAAMIWTLQGKDEDYMFGYTEEELEGAL